MVVQPIRLFRCCFWMVYTIWQNEHFDVSARAGNAENMNVYCFFTFNILYLMWAFTLDVLLAHILLKNHLTFFCITFLSLAVIFSLSYSHCPSTFLTVLILFLSAFSKTCHYFISFLGRCLFLYCECVREFSALQWLDIVHSRSRMKKNTFVFVWRVEISKIALRIPTPYFWSSFLFPIFLCRFQFEIRFSLSLWPFLQIT